MLVWAFFAVAALMPSGRLWNRRGHPVCCAMALFHSVRRPDHQADGHGALEATCLKIVRVARVVNASWQKWTTDKNKNQSRRAKSLLHIYWRQ
ncbi:uncharacterized protein BKA55DRAFT_721212 [Fusarium redolens]|uniref:Secreted protein n=1 Tax=Fusarium redolens TaxID=48865 RepID=A0A9P9FXD1_FUSRE|nr:uncharacterized protein BKA55DRAFT_723328 [Fusarium redolens]XP_046041081.1 uncharacterized protein BKA55DRAFT_721212 [Fusarium redolens]KAH7203094.1 hypothetical protein BKA55DRAFT_723328 [Fusarium redolens]KAH7205488.1 hypothetical protein BKA55DRAFT_721212 [Fusarium redolens]